MDKTYGANVREVIIIREDAYKQNDVYRPWSDIWVAPPETSDEESPAPARRKRNPFPAKLL